MNKYLYYYAIAIRELPKINMPATPSGEISVVRRYDSLFERAGQFIFWEIPYIVNIDNIFDALERGEAQVGV